jgi:hypothetical protein
LGLFTVAGMASALARTMGDLGLAAGVGVAVGLAANLVLARVAASGGTAAAMALGQSVAVVLAARQGQRRLPVGFGWARIAFLCGLTAAAVLIVTAVPGGTSVAARCVVATAFVIALWGEGTTRDAFRPGR